MYSIFDEPLPIKDFSGNNIDEYILKINETNEYHGERKCLQEKIKGQKLFKSKFINDFKFSIDESNVYVVAKVRAEMKKTSYDVKLTISLDNEVKTFFKYSIACLICIFFIYMLQKHTSKNHLVPSDLKCCQMLAENQN